MQRLGGQLVTKTQTKSLKKHMNDKRTSHELKLIAFFMKTIPKLIS